MPISPPPVLPNLVQAAHMMTVDELKWYVEAVTDRAPTRKGELIVKYVAALTDAAIVRRLWNELTPLQEQVVAEVAYRDDGQFVIELLEAKYPGVKRPANPRGYTTFGWSFGTGSGRKGAEPYDVFFMFNGEYGVFMPPELRAVVHDIAPPPPPFELRSSVEAPSVPRPATMREPPEVFRSTTERAVLHDLAATLFLIQQGKVAISATTKSPTLATLRLLRQRLLMDEYLPQPIYERAEDAVRPFALIMLVQAARWAGPTTAGNKLELTKSGQALLPGPLGAHYVREAWERWVKTDMLDELSRIRAIKGQHAKGVRLTKPSERRQQIVESLRACPTERWIEMDDYLRFLRATDQLPQIERGTTTALHLGSYAESGWLGYADVNYWDIVNGSYIRILLWEYAATLGMVEIAYTEPEDAVHDFGHAYGLDEYEYLSKYDGLLGFRITALGAYVLGLAAEYTPPAELVETGPPVLTILPNLDVVVVDAPRFSMTDRAMLERIGVVQSTDVYRLQREHLLDALEHGLTLEQVKLFLATRSGTAPDAFPQTVQVFFQDVQRRSTALRDGGKMIVVEGDDPLLLTELAHSSELRTSVQLATIGERAVLLVPEEREAAVRRGLRKLGYLARKG